MIQLTAIKKQFGEKVVLDDVKLTIKEGELFTFLGPSGCGKTTLLRIISGFEKSEGGHIYIDGVEVSNIPPEKRHIGMVFQHYSLFPHMNVFDNIAYGLKVSNITKTEQKNRVIEMLKIVGLEGFEKRSVQDLSGGEQQRVAIARALVVKPKVLLMDEPLSNLDAFLREEIRLEIRRIVKEIGITTLFVTHDQEEAMMLSDKLAIFQNGKIIQNGNPLDIYDHPINCFAATFIGDSNIFTPKEMYEMFNKKTEKMHMIRPEMIEINEKGKGALIQSIIFKGHMVDITCKFKGKDVLVRKLHNGQQIYMKGDKIFLDFHLEDFRSLEEEV